jgi:orotidine-5'-phosphate decarboxylase
MQHNPILVALDVPTLPEALAIVEAVHPYVGGFKVGMELCMHVGPQQVIDAISAIGGNLFVDLKFKDIPNTVAGAARAMARPGVLMFNIHCDGGAAMLRATVEAVAGSEHRPLVIGVTVLTSINDTMIQNETHVSGSVAEQALHLAKLGQAAGIDGVVCSAHEVAAIKKSCGLEFLTVVPGIRPEWSAKDDQQRIMTPMEAIQIGADYLVIGRAITRPPSEIGSPAEAARRIAAEIGLI